MVADRNARHRVGDPVPRWPYDTTVANDNSRSSNRAQRGAEIRATDGITGSGLYSTVIGEEYAWEHAYTTSEWLELISTHSDHRLLKTDVRQHLFDEVGQAIDGRGGVHRFAT